ncbi:MAG: hypothetical protein ACR2P8_05430, partial [Myxococcota bacterium]
MGRAELGLIGALLALHVAFSLAVVPGHLSVDECTYHLMAKGLADHRELRFRNGYEEFPSLELVPVSVVAHEGHLYPVTPPTHAVLAWPFYRAAGYPGLFLLNNLAFLATLLMTARLARRLFGDRRLALVAVLVLALATYLWEYSQASWPHALSTALVLGAFAAAWSGFCARSEGRALAWCALAGLVAGIGVGVRLDVALSLPCLVVPFLFAPPRRLAAAAGIALGALPGLLAIALANASKFGVATPFSYGPRTSDAGDWTGYLPVAGLGLFVRAGGRLAASASVSAGLRRTAWLLPALVGAGVAVLLATPALRELVARLASGTAILVWDLRGLPLELERPALARSAGGGLVYFGHLKKSLLQSLPYLPVLLLATLAALRGHRDAGRLAALALVPGAFLAAYAFFSWDGGMVLNLRYLAPTLPFLAIAVAWSLRELWRDLSLREPLPWLVAWLTAALWWLWIRPVAGDADRVEARLLLTPLWIASGIALLALAVGWLGARTGRPLRLALASLVACGLVWAGLAALVYDYPAAREMRAFNRELSRRALAVLEPESIVFTTHPDPFCGL